MAKRDMINSIGVKKTIETKVEFETFRDLTSGYDLSNMRKDKPSAINFLSYRRYKVSIELIEEPNEILIERLQNMLLDKEIAYNQKTSIRYEIKRLGGVIE